MKKRRLMSFVPALAVFLLCVSLVGDVFGRAQRLRLTTLAPKDSSFHKHLLRMGQEWKQATNGQVSLVVFAGGVQGGEGAMLDRMRINQTQASLISGIGLSELDLAVAGFQKIPLLFRNLGELERVMAEMTPKLETRIEDKGFVVLTWIDSGWVHIFSKQLIEGPDDMQRGKMFTQTGDPRQTDMLKKLGFRPVPIESTDITPGLQTGLIDTVPLPPFYALASQAFKPAPHMLHLNYVPIVGAIVVSERAWRRIEPEHQAAVKEIAQRYGKEMTASGRRENAQSIDVMRDKFGLKVREMDETLSQEWEQLAIDVYPYIRDTTVPADIFDEMTGLLKAYRSEEQAEIEVSTISP